MGRLVEGIDSRRRPAHEMGCRGHLADLISYTGAWLTRWVARGAWLTRWVVGGVLRTPGNKHQDPEVVRENVKSWGMAGRCGEICDGIER